MDQVKNFVFSIVSQGYDADDVEIEIENPERFPDIDDGQFNLVWFNQSAYANPAEDPNVEIVRVTDIDGSTLTIQRAQEGTTASTKNQAGCRYAVFLAFTKKSYTDLIATAGAVLSVFGRTGAVVATSGDYDAGKITETASRVFVTPAEKTAITHTNRTALDLVSGTNTGDETALTIKTKLGTASATTDGYLTQGDWATFNAKQSALGFTPEQQLTFSSPLSRNVNTISVDLSAVVPYTGATGDVNLGAHSLTGDEFMVTVAGSNYVKIYNLGGEGGVGIIGLINGEGNESTIQAGDGYIQIDQALIVRNDNQGNPALQVNGYAGQTQNLFELVQGATFPYYITPAGNSVLLGNAKSASVETTGNIELGHATDTTISRVSAGVIAVEGTAIPKGTGTANELAYWSDTNTLGTLAVATYPSLTEISYVKGVTSALQTQLGAKVPYTGATANVALGTYRLTFSDGGSASAPKVAIKDDNTGLYQSYGGRLQFAVGGSEMLRIDTADAVSVIGSIPIKMNRAGSATAPAYTWIANVGSGTGMYKPATSNIGLSTDGVERIRILATGEVGIGTSTVTSNFKSEIAGALRINYGSDSVSAIEINASGVDTQPAFKVVTPATGAQKGFQIQTTAESYGWASFEKGIGGTTKPGFSLGSGAVARDTNLYRDSANVLKTDDTFVAANLSTGGTLELGHASDTTLSRSAAGVLAVEGVVIPSISSTDTLTNKRVTPRVGTTTSSTTPTINTDNVDIYLLTAQTTDITSFTTNLSGTPTNGQKLWISITGTAARAITWGSSFEASTIALPTTTVSTNRLDVGFIWNAATSKWRCVGVA